MTIAGFDAMEHLPALQVVVPLLGSVIAAMIREGRTCWLLSVIVCWSMPVISALLLHQVLVEGTVSYALGGWAPPIGIEYRVDAVNGFLLLLVSIVAALVILYAPRSIASEIGPENRGWYYSMFLMCLCGLQGMAISGDAFNIFVFTEISSLATYVLIAMGRDRRALFAAFQYLMIGTIGATFYVIGAGILYALTGTLNLVDIAQRLDLAEHARASAVALAFIGIGFALKFALFPLHLWLPNAYAFAPSVATAFLASTATKVAVYLLARFAFSVFGIDADAATGTAIAVVLAVAVIAMIGPSVIAIFQKNVKRMLAYSSVAQIGYIVLGIALLSEAGLTGGFAHIFNHAIIKGALFLAIGCVVYSTGVTRIEEMAGLGRTMPLTMGAFVLAGLGLIGVPGTAGFVSKWYLIQGAAEQELWWLVAAIVIASLLAVVYVGRVVEIAWFRKPEGATHDPADTPFEMLAVTWALTLAVVYFGLQTDISAGVPAQAAEVLLGGYGRGE
jgi:multicomponent Na+:H+ antiporter subunit D